MMQLNNRKLLMIGNIGGVLISVYLAIVIPDTLSKLFIASIPLLLHSASIGFRKSYFRISLLIMLSAYIIYVTIVLLYIYAFYLDPIPLFGAEL